METDAELLRRYVEDHAQDAFATLVQRHLPLVYGTALRRVGFDAHAAEDVAQTVFTDLARKAASLRGHAALTGWLVVGTQRAAAAVVRSEQRRKAREREAHTMQTLVREPPSEGDPRQLRPLLDAAFVQLAADERDAIALRFFEKRSFAEIGAALRLTDEAARKRVERAVEKLRRILGRGGVTSTSAALAATLAAAGGALPPTGLAVKIAGHALAHGAAAGAGTAAGWGAALLGSVGLVVGLVGVVHQHQVNRALEAELARLPVTSQSVAAIRAENQHLARVLAEADTLRAAQAELPALRAAFAPTLSPAAAAAPARATVTVTAQGTILWNGQRVPLDTFLVRLAELEQTAPAGEAKVGIRGFSSFSPLAYVITETRKADVRHAVVESSAAFDQKLGLPTWFDLP